MTTITREEVKAFIEQIESDLSNGWEAQIFELKLARIALASLEAEPVSQTYNLPELIEGMEVSIDVSTCDADAGNRYFGTVTEVSELYTAKNGYILLVQDAKPNFDVNGNTPVQSPIDHGYRPECECSGCKATARICAELNNEEAEIFADGYNAAMQSFGNSEQLNSPVIPDGWISCSERMPDKLIPVIVMYEDGEMWSAMWNGNRWDDGTEYPDPHSVTHWREMPAAPQQEVNRG
ncbi:DUF551 domain-containing protein [Salmonella enterica]|nr:DUF551 domain-containing protein [Salmonella enterica]EGO0062341.1 DUF551 domain-containing protein [Salmonella enterica]EGP6856960.1 DUF551 domain-containing protein [Salmonella enterica]EGP8174013.1 DUF551 domain-containing protein [Salmonella enterica]